MRGCRLTIVVGAVCSAAALSAGWLSIPGPELSSPSQVTSAEVPARFAFSNAAPTSVTEATPLVSPAAASAVAFTRRLNDAREAGGLPRLDPDPRLDTVALARALDLVEKGYFDHYGPAGESPFRELRERGIRYRVAGENLARNSYQQSRSVEAAFDSLMASESHRANILEPRFHSVGVAAIPDGKLWLYVTIFTD